MVHRERAVTLGRGEFTSHPRPRAVAPLGGISRSTRSAPMASAALNPNSFSAAAFQLVTLPSMPTLKIPSSDDLTSDASRACSRSSFTNSEMSGPIAPIVSVLPRASWMGKRLNQLSNAAPSARMPRSLRLFDTSARAISSSAEESRSGSCGERRSKTVRSSAASDGTPKSRSAPRFQLTTLPSRPARMTALLDDSTSSASVRCCRWARFCSVMLLTIARPRSHSPA